MIAKTIIYQKEQWSDNFPTEIDSSETLILLFGDSSFKPNNPVFKELIENFPKSKIMGCSTSGEILGDTIRDNSLTATFVRFEKTKIKCVYAPISKAEQSFAAGAKISRSLNQTDLVGVLVFSDGLNVNGSELVAGINSVLSPQVAVTGGLAGDKNNFKKTWVIKEGLPTPKFISAVGFYGNNLKIGHGSKDGLDIFGIERKVTKSFKNHLFELDGRPALQLYKEYLGERAVELPASALFFPLSMRNSLNEEKRIVRTILGINEKKQSMTFAGDIPEGSLVQLMTANIDRVIDGAADAANYAIQTIDPSQKTFSIAISCVGRRLILGERAEEELEAVVETLPQDSQLVGFYSYGEISPFAEGYCDLHNQTMTITTFNEV